MVPYGLYYPERRRNSAENSKNRYAERGIDMEKTQLKSVLEKNLNWFRNSSVMEPANGFWGVAERIYICEDRELRRRVFRSFNSFTEYDGWNVIESRRADCNMQLAYLFLLASEIDGNDAEKRSIAINLLDYLYFRSGLMNRGDTPGVDNAMTGVWNWSHTHWRRTLWLDDNSWTLAIPLLIAKRYPELIERYDMTFWIGRLAEELRTGFDRAFEYSRGKAMNDMSDPLDIWFGRPLLPHWGSLCCFALALACRGGFDPECKIEKTLRDYHEYLASAGDDVLNVSELAYAVIGATSAYKATGDKFYLDLAVDFEKRILAKADPVTGNVPAEHYEAPKGPHLVDTIYTANWIIIGLQNLIALVDGDTEKTFREYFEKMLQLFATIQDTSPERQFNGCWRGMFDMKAGTWGGGDSYEGGAGSIYSGWTNAPVSLVFANELLGISLID